jgi:CO/xanthine dehydrogenase FAD-binding subunit
LLVGETDLLTLMKADITTPVYLADIKRLSDLPDGMTETDSGVLLNVLTTLIEIETHSTIDQRYEALAETAVTSATPLLQNMAMMGRNLLQPRAAGASATRASTAG